MRIRALGYTGALFVVPVAWRIGGRKEPFPRQLDLAVALPLLLDAAGNAVGIYDRAHVDDADPFRERRPPVVGGRRSRDAA